MSTRRILKKDDRQSAPAPASVQRPALGSNARPQQLALGAAAAGQRRLLPPPPQQRQQQQRAGRREGCWQAWLRRLGLTFCCGGGAAKPRRRGQDGGGRSGQAAASSLLRVSETAGSSLCETARLYDAGGGGGSEEDGASSCEAAPRDVVREVRPPADRRGGWRYSDTASTSSSTSSLRSTSYFRSEESVSSSNSRYSSRMYSDEKSCASSTHTSSMNASNEGAYWSPQQERRQHGRRQYNRGRGRRQDSSWSSSGSSSCSDSMTDSTVSLNVITVTLHTDATNFLGISIVGQSGNNGDGGIYVGSVMQGGAVDIDGRIEAGDMILEVNGQSFDRLSNDEAVRLLRDAVKKPGPITLVVAKCWEAGPLMTTPAAASREADRRNAFLTPRQEPVRPIDPLAWVAHTTALQNQAAAASAVGVVVPLPGGAGGGAGVHHRLPPAAAANPLRAYDAGHGDGSLDSASTCSSGDATLLPDAAYGASPSFAMGSSTGVRPDAAAVVAAMARPDSGLDIRDRTWLKVTIPSAFIGSDLVDWLLTRVRGFIDRGDACSYAAGLLKAGYIQHTVNKEVFSEQCYYVFGSPPHKVQNGTSRNSYANLGCAVSPTDAQPPSLPARRAVQQQPYAVSSVLLDSSQLSRSFTSRQGDRSSGVDRPLNMPTSGKVATATPRPVTLVAPPRPLAAVPAELTNSRASFHAAMENPWGRDLCSEEAV